jgi:hypothetical protein
MVILQTAAGRIFDRHYGPMLLCECECVGNEHVKQADATSVQEGGV